jgi:hypothetical protein
MDSTGFVALTGLVGFPTFVDFPRVVGIAVDSNLSTRRHRHRRPHERDAEPLVEVIAAWISYVLL